MRADQNTPWPTLFITFALASCSAAISFYWWSRNSRSNSNGYADKIQELEAALKVAEEKCSAERQGRIRAQRALREALNQPHCGKAETKLLKAYPMAQIGVVKSCFSTRNGTPRQPLLVPLARASLIFDLTRVPHASLEGLEGYSHCWIIYVFHLNTNLDKLWNKPSQSKFKAKVRVPRLKGEKVGLFATRSPHRPCPIGLTVAKVEAVHGHTVLLSGVDLVDGTPILDIKPYLPYCDSITGATVPDWVKMDDILAVPSVSFSEDFSSSLTDCWAMEKKSLYFSPDEYLSLIKQVLSWDIRSLAQRSHPHNALLKTDDCSGEDGDTIVRSYERRRDFEHGHEPQSLSFHDVVYHLVLEGLDVSYRIDPIGNVLVEKVCLGSSMQNGNENI
ncbi:uncharacterized protein [Henckelia pumila]|uniref:uncharacterized protein isoform X2 n=1 Tax=Henckelia pumila TaxID=405737 RepID=UPI003C6E98C7